MIKPHVRRSATQWATLIDKQTASGLSIRDFCVKHDLGFSTFSKWKRKLHAGPGDLQPTDREADSAFTPVQIHEGATSPVASTSITLSLDDGITLTIERALSPT